MYLSLGNIARTCLVTVLALSATAFADHTSANMAIKQTHVLAESFRSALTLANAGNTEAQYALARMYEKGVGVEQNIQEAITWYERAGEQGHSKALYRLGYYFLLGKGVEKNLDKAFNYMQQAAQLGYGRAQYYLAGMYRKGMGVAVDLEQARLYYKLALAAGESRAKPALQQLHELNTTPDTRPDNGAKSRNRRVKNNGDPAQDGDTAGITDYTSLFTSSIMGGEWLSRGKPTHLFPSSMTTCRPLQSDLIECQSKQLQRVVGNANITYETKTLIRNQPEEGGFQLSYRNNVLHVEPQQAGEELDGLAQTIKIGWQEIPHKYRCRFESQINVAACQRNKINTLKLVRALDGKAQVAASGSISEKDP